MDARLLCRLVIARVCTFAGLALLASSIFLGSALPSLATQVRPLNLEEMTHKADRIVHGRCIGTRTEIDPDLGIPVTVVTLHVDRAVRGVEGPRLTFRMPAGHESTGAGFAGLPGFDPGEELILFLYGDSRLGLTSPVGLGQGKFVVARDKQGRRVARNEHGNRMLFQRLSSDATAKWEGSGAAGTRRGGIDPELLMRLVRELDR